MAPPASWPQDMPADSLECGNPGFGPRGIEVETQGFQTVRLITSQKFPSKKYLFDFFHTNCLRSTFPYVSNIYESG